MHGLTKENLPLILPRFLLPRRRVDLALLNVVGGALLTT